MNSPHVTTPLNRTYDLELPSLFVQTPKFTASSPCELAADFTPSPVKQASRWIGQGFDTPDWKPASGLQEEFYPVESEVLKQSLETHFSSSKNRPKDLLSAPRSMHRGPVKDKTPEGSAKRGRLLQALRTAHLERNEGVLDQLICNVTPASSTATQMPPPSYWDSALRGRTNNISRTPLYNPFSPATPFASIIRTEKYGGVRDPSFKENALKDDKTVAFDSQVRFPRGSTRTPIISPKVRVSV
ncbi:hypothetical protein EG68_11828 [Paragonimus skrjabini miyazakii]|uniref:Uncharacterized protein n=1 Tax=Paragonimus skrjabini miyazakii TaxID=59628 RepID=A0A8S9YDX4_9TREM|nr:hypothetical protein EG68_11828 [Paragonimus skrjabini miyazakii]